MIHIAYPPVSKINKDKHPQKLENQPFATINLFLLAVPLKYRYILILCNGPVTI